MMINRHGIVPTEELIKKLQDEYPPGGGIEKLTPGQQVRVRFSIALRQIAYATKADPMLGFQMFEMIEAELERTVDSMFASLLSRVYRDARDDAERLIRWEMEERDT